ncbi:polysaccharide deacetylase family protein (plasmid) [Mycolicibacterium psychrotolerans]|uniref:polysaccharide deacetylase family protein n=1 Tax=Mycolicibacterium psychrotolerans TaxID=216929 RepID=UPI003D67DB42
MSSPVQLWPGDKPIAVAFNVCLEAWSEGKAPGINPMGNPLPPTVLDRMAISWAEYGVRSGIQRLLRGLARYDVRASVAVNGIVAEQHPAVVRTVADAGHELVGHSYAMDVVPGLLSAEDEQANIDRCTSLIGEAGGVPVTGWLSPRATPSDDTPALLAAAGYHWHGDTLNDDLPYLQTFGDRDIVAIPFNTDVNDMPSMKYGAAPERMVEAFTESIEAARESGEMTLIDVTSHAHIFGRPRGAHFHEQVLAIAAAAPEVWIATKAEIAAHVRQSSGAPVG